MPHNTPKNIALACFGFFTIYYIYKPGLSGPFIFDDLVNITRNSLLRIQDLSLSSLYSSATAGSAGPLKRPIAMLSFALNYYFADGYATSAFKITNVIIHCVNALLVFIMCQQLFERASVTTRKKHHHTAVFFSAAGISLIWAVHPINLTSVLYIVQRMTSLSTLFSLACIIFYISARNKWLTNPFNWRTTFLFLASIISFIFAIFSKENALIVPLLLLLIELVLYSKEKPWSIFDTLSQRLKFTSYAALLSISLAALVWAINYASGGFDSRPFTMLERVLTESRVLCFYISLILIPRIDGFGLFHDDIALSTSLLSPWTTVTSIVFIVGLLVAAFYYRKKNPLFTAGIGWFFIGHLLESTFFPLEIAHEHRNNLPSIGIIIAAFSLVPFEKLDSKKVVASVTFISLILGSTTWLRAKQWGNYQTLAYFEATHHPDSPSIQALLSNAANQAGDITMATQAIKKAMTLEPNETAYAMHYQNILAIHGKPIPTELQKETLRSIEANRLTPSTQLALDQIAGCLKKEPCAPLKENYIEWITAVIEKMPTNAIYRYMRGKAYRATGNDLAALNDYQKAHDISDDFLHPLFEMADILLRMGQISHAEEVVMWIEEANEKTNLRRDRELEELKLLVVKIKKLRSKR